MCTGPGAFGEWWLRFMYHPSIIGVVVTVLYCVLVLYVMVMNKKVTSTSNDRRELRILAQVSLARHWTSAHDYPGVLARRAHASA